MCKEFNLGDWVFFFLQDGILYQGIIHSKTTIETLGGKPSSHTPLASSGPQRKHLMYLVCYSSEDGDDCTINLPESKMFSSLEDIKQNIEFQVMRIENQ